MTLEELCFMTNTQIQMTFPDVNGKWYCSLSHAEIARDGMLAGDTGRGDGPEAALLDYCRQIKGKVLVVNGNTDKESRYNIPKSFVYKESVY